MATTGGARTAGGVAGNGRLNEADRRVAAAWPSRRVGQPSAAARRGAGRGGPARGGQAGRTPRADVRLRASGDRPRHARAADVADRARFDAATIASAFLTAAAAMAKGWSAPRSRSARPERRSVSPSGANGWRRYSVRSMRRMPRAGPIPPAPTAVGGTWRGKVSGSHGWSRRCCPRRVAIVRASTCRWRSRTRWHGMRR